MTLITQIVSIWPLFAVVASAIVWNIRLEGRVNSSSDKIIKLEEKATSADDTKIEVVRLQEQIKNLAGLLERFIDRHGGSEF